MNQRHAFVTVRDLIDGMANVGPNLVFLISPESGRFLTFEELQQNAVRLCAWFQQLGLERGEKVAFILDNGLFTAELFLGAMYGGFVSVPFNVRAGVSALAAILEHSDAKIVLVSRDHESLAREVMAHVKRPIMVVPCDSDHGMGETITGLTGTLPPIEPEDPALLMYTSGSTGQPKGAVHTHKSILAHGRNSFCSHKLTSADRSLLVLPLYHINAECVTLIPTLLSGGSVVIPHHFVVSRFWDWLDDFQCTWSALVPTIISQLLDWKDPKSASRATAFERIRFLRSSSAPLAPSLHREFLDKFKLPLIQAMGCSELGNVFSNPVPPGTNKIGSPGLPWGIEAKIVNRDGAEVPTGESGEILLRGDAMMRGYYKDPVGTAAAVDLDGWLHTGDLAYQDADGYFFVVGRSKELIIKGGMNIAPKQIDEILESHPAVLEAAAVGIPDRYVGEDVVAFAVLRNGMNCDERELLAFCEDRLGHFKTPTRIQFVQDLPKGPSGKVQRLRLVAEAERPTVARSVSLADGSEIPAVNAHGTQNGHPAKELPIEQIIAGIWSELLAQPRIDSQTNFFELGGHSLLAIQYLSRLREKVPVMLSLSDFFENATVAQQSTLVRTRLTSLPVQETSGKDQWIVDSQPIPLRDRTVPCPLSPAQERLWFMEQLNPGVPVYNEAEGVRLRGTLDVGALEQSLNVIIARHEILRSTIQVINEKPTVVVHESWPLILKRIDLHHLPAEQRNTEVEHLLIEEPRLPYNLQAEPGIRATLIRLADAEHVFILMMHHIICDWSSEGVLWRELSACYRDLTHGKAPALPPLAIQHGDYAVWQKQQMADGAYKDDLEYWESNLRGAPGLLDLPADYPRPPAITYRGARNRFRIGSTLVKIVRDCSRREKISLFTLFTAAVKALLFRYTGSEDILVGLPLADRDRRELQSIIGFLLHVHVLRTPLSGEMTFRELLARIQQEALDLYAHRSPPFDQIVSRVQPERNVSYSPLIQVIINWRDRDQQLTFIGMDGLTVESLLAETRTSKFDLTFILTDDGDEIWLEVEYNTDLFEEARIERMAGHFRTLLGAAATDPGRSLAQLPILTDAERHQILVDWNRSEAEYPKDRSVHELVEEQAGRRPEAVAVVDEGKQLTYGELNARANQLARHLKALGVKPDIPVGICVERSLNLVVGLLGILKAGGAYLPLDPAYPKERLAFMLNDAGVEVLLTHQQFRAEPTVVNPDCKIFCLDTGWESLGTGSTENLKNETTCDNLAYVIYTSGSTGEPKGVELSQGGLLNLIFWHRRTYQVSSADRATQLAGVGFDASVWELWPYLTAGASIHIPDEDTRLLPEKLRDWLIAHEITLSFVPTPLAEAMVGLQWPSKTGLRAMLTGGDRLNRRVPPSLPFPLINHYGPTESTVVTTCAAVEVDGKTAKAPPIGRPIANTQIYLLDNHLQPVPVGMPGELHIGGNGLARGYLHRPDLTAEKFVANPFSANPGARLYKTGDLARYLSSGMVEFLGRNDAQVKIRGFRIELAEIESVLAEHPGIGTAALVARGNGSDDKHLVAYVTVHAAKPTGTELREYLKKRIPDYMVPSVFVVLDRLPVTSNGKVDRAVLPSPDATNRLPEEEGAAPVTRIEKTLAGVVASLLKLDKVDREANFFDLGGHSLLGTQLIARIRDKFGIDFPLRRIFESPTVAALSAEIENNLVAEVEGMSEVEVQDSINSKQNARTEGTQNECQWPEGHPSENSRTCIEPLSPA